MLTLLLLIIVVIMLVVATTRFKVHPFLTLIMAALAMGLVSGLDGSTVIVKITEGFGGTLKSIGIIIAFGTIIGAYLEKSGAAKTMAAAVRIQGRHRYLGLRGYRIYRFWHSPPYRWLAVSKNRPC